MSGVKNIVYPMCFIESSPDYSQETHHRVLFIDEVMCSIIVAEHKVTCTYVKLI